MGQHLEITCGACGGVFTASNGEPGGVYACPQCGTKNRASRPPRAPGATHRPGTAGPSLRLSDRTASPYWPSTWWGNSLLAAGLAYICATTMPASILGGTLTAASVYAVLMVARYVAVVIVRRRGQVVSSPRRSPVVVLRNACFAAAIGSAVSGIGSCQSVSALNSELTTAEGALSEAQGALTEMNSVGYGVALAVEGFLRGFVGDFGGVLRRFDEETAAHATLTDCEGTVLVRMRRLAARKEAAEAQTAWAIVLAVLSLCGGVYFAKRANTASTSVDWRNAV